MTRREFMHSLFPWRRDIPLPETPTARPASEGPGRELFLEAMRLGIDPATLAPRHLEDILAGRNVKPSTTEDKWASGNDLAGPPDALCRPQQRGGPDGDQRHPYFVPGKS